jgi:hypothetical protein
MFTCRPQFGQTIFDQSTDGGDPTRTGKPHRGHGPSRWLPRRVGAMLPVGTPNGSTANVRRKRNSATNPTAMVKRSRTGFA